MSEDAPRVGDHVSFYRMHALHKTYGVLRAIRSTPRGTFAEVCPEGSDHTLDLPIDSVALYARRGATK